MDGKPSWENAPFWAEYLARDKQGWKWFEYEPKYRNRLWLTNTIDEKWMTAEEELYKNSLEKKPKT